MKAFLPLLVLISTNTFARSFECHETNSKNPRTVILKNKSIKPFREGEKFAYEMRVLKAPSDGSSTPLVELETKGTAVTEDVLFYFQSLDKKAALQIYLDEMDQSTLRINNKESSVVCDYIN